MRSGKAWRTLKEAVESYFFPSSPDPSLFFILPLPVYTLTLPACTLILPVYVLPLPGYFVHLTSSRSATSSQDYLNGFIQPIIQQ